MQEWLDAYGESHQNPTNKRIHWVCVPLIFLTITVGWAAISQMQGLLGAEVTQWPQVIVLGFGMLLQLWMVTEGLLCIRQSRSGASDDGIDALGVVRA